MKFEVFNELSYEVYMPTTFIFNIQVARSAHQTIIKESLQLEPYLAMEEFTSGNNETRFLRLQVAKKQSFKISYSATVDLNYQLIDFRKHEASTPVNKLDPSMLPYLFPSRYCQSDKLQRLAVKEFGGFENDYEKVQAINDWIFNNVEYLSGSTNSSTSAFDTLTERAGVCRDFAHLGIALCRALSIPARYFTGYAYQLEPQDFHACFEAYIGDKWVFFDPTKLVPLNGLVKIANGRDAADASVASIFGNTFCNSIMVGSKLLGQDFKPYRYDKRRRRGISYE